MNEVLVRVKRVGGVSGGTPLPSRMTAGSAGLDLYASLAEDLVLRPLERALIPTGIAIELPSGYAGEVRPRSGLAWERGITLLNAPGTIDQDYRGEIMVVLINLGSAPVEVRPGERIAQLLVHEAHRVVWEEALSLSPTPRGSRGFGSTDRRPGPLSHGD